MGVPPPGDPRRSIQRKHERETFFKYTTAEVASIVLRTRKLRWSSPILFDDLFDSAQELRLQFDEGELFAAFVEHMARLVEEGAPPPETSSVAVRYVLGSVKGKPPEVRMAIARDLRASMRQPSEGMVSSFANLKA